MDADNNMLKVLIVDDHDVVREGIKKLLGEEPDIAVTAEARNASDAIKRVRSETFDIILLDISLPGQSGLEIIEYIKIEQPKLPILVLSMYPESQFALRALKSGAAGYINKAEAIDKLVNGIRSVCKGNIFVSPSLTSKLVSNLRGDDDKPGHEKLTDREYEVMLMITDGKELKEIADDLSISEKTARTHRTRILQKLGLKNNVELTKYAITNKLI